MDALTKNIREVAHNIRERRCGDRKWPKIVLLANPNIPVVNNPARDASGFVIWSNITMAISCPLKNALFGHYRTYPHAQPGGGGGRADFMPLPPISPGSTPMRVTEGLKLSCLPGLFVIVRRSLLGAAWVRGWENSVYCKSSIRTF